MGGENRIQLHFGTSLLQEQHLVGFGGHGVAAGTTRLGRGRKDSRRFTGTNRPPAAGNVAGRLTFNEKLIMQTMYLANQVLAEAGCFTGRR